MLKFVQESAGLPVHNMLQWLKVNIEEVPGFKYFDYTDLYR